jgi:hypothetical protein
MDFYLLLGGALIVAFPIAMFVVARLIAPDGARLANLFKAPTDLGWPRGVQEEEPTRWGVDRLDASKRPPASEPNDLPRLDRTYAAREISRQHRA